jgi:hypothetical protein
VVSGGAIVASSHVVAVTDAHPPTAVFDEPNTACTPNSSAPTAAVEDVRAHAVPPALRLLAFVDSAHLSVRIPESLSTVIDDAELSNAWFGVPLQLCVRVLEATPSTLTDFAAVMVTLMFTCAGFAASAVVASTPNVRAAKAPHSLLFAFIVLSPWFFELLRRHRHLHVLRRRHAR